MPRRRQRYLSGLGDAESAVLGAKEDEVSWADVFGTAAASLPGLIEKIPGAVHAYETHGGGTAGVRAAIIPIFGQPAAHEPEEHEEESRPVAATAPDPPPSGEWYESPGFLVVTGLAVGLVVAVAARRRR